MLVEEGKYFTINRACQYGKTTTLTHILITHSGTQKSSRLIISVSSLASMMERTLSPTKKFHRLKAEYEASLTASKTGPVSTDICLRQFHVATYLLDRIAEKAGIASDLGKCHGSLAPQILSIAYYLVI